MRLPIPDTLEVITFRPAQSSDADSMVALFQRFFAESTLPSYGLRYDPRRMYEWLCRVLDNWDVTHIIAVDKETQKVVGSIAYALRQTYTEQPMAEMDKFYVLPEWRNSAIGHILLTMAMEIAKDEGAAIFRAGLSSGISSGQNLFRKHGFRETPHSILLVKEL